MAKLYICAQREDRHHCNYHCGCGWPHVAERCTIEDFCQITMQFIRCIPAGNRVMAVMGGERPVCTADHSNDNVEHAYVRSTRYKDVEK